MITGIFFSDDLTEYLQKNPIFDKIMNFEIRQVKRQRFRDKQKIKP